MSVEESLGYTGAQIAEVVGENWTTWSTTCTDLSLVEDLSDIRKWLMEARPELADKVLHGVARLANANGENQPLAGVVLAWCLAPMAGTVANECAWLNADIDAETAAQLWIAVRTFPWRSSRFVVSHVRRTLRHALLRDLASGPRAIPTPIEALQEIMDDPRHRAAPSAGEELTRLLSDAIVHGALRGDEAALLLAVLNTAHELDPSRRSAAAVLGERVSNHLAGTYACSGRTVRRRARRSLETLARFAAGETDRWVRTAYQPSSRRGAA